MTSASTKKQIYNLVGIFFCATAIGLGLAAYMAYSFGPSSEFIARDVLLSPDVLSKISYRTYDPKANKTLKFVFDKIEFTYFDSLTKSWKTRKVTLEAYSKFYDLIGNEKSISNVTPELKSPFQQPILPHLTLSVKTEQGQESRPFQNVEIIPNGDYFRVELHEDAPAKEPWSYFNYSHIYQFAVDMFTKDKG